MRSLNTSRVWIAGGAVIGLLLVAATYLLVVAPARTDAATVQSQIDDATLTQSTLRHKLRDLEAAAQDQRSLRAAGAAAAAAIPVTADTQGLLRQLQTDADAHRVTVGSVSIGDGAATSVEGVWALPVTLDLTGAPTDLLAVVTALQARTGRALSVASTTLALVGDAGATLSLDVRVYCSTDPGTVAGGPAAGGGAAAGSGSGGAPAGGAVSSGPTTNAS